MSSFCKKCGSWMAGESCTVCGNAGANKPDPMSKTHCPGCGKMVDANLAYCPECGKEINVKVVALGKSAPNWENPKTSKRASTHCPACKALIDITERFCPECGKDVLKTYATCPHCGKRVQDDAEFCPECGGKMKKEIVKEVVNKMMCPNCNGKIEEGMVFCPHCGHNVKEPKKCAGCGKELADGVKFCPYCGQSDEVKAESSYNAQNRTQETEQNNKQIPTTARLSHSSPMGVYEFLETLEPNLDFIYARSGNDIKAQLLGIFAMSIIKTYILAFNADNIYVCQLSNWSAQDIVHIKKYSWSEIQSFTTGGAGVGKMLKFVTKYGELKFRTQKIALGGRNQGDDIEKLLKLQK